MKRIKDTDIYPKFEFRLRHDEKEWLMSELAALKVKFNAEGSPPIGNNALVVAALRHGFRHLKRRRRLLG